MIIQWDKEHMEEMIYRCIGSLAKANKATIKVRDIEPQPTCVKILSTVYGRAIYTETFTLDYNGLVDYLGVERTDTGVLDLNNLNPEMKLELGKYIIKTIWEVIYNK